jgi:hypothetical protein
MATHSWFTAYCHKPSTASGKIKPTALKLKRCVKSPNLANHRRARAGQITIALVISLMIYLSENFKIPACHPMTATGNTLATS